MFNTILFFQPCTSKSEDTSKEVIASFIDQLLQWGQTAPVITRRIPIQDFEKLFANDNSSTEYTTFMKTGLR